MGFLNHFETPCRWTLVTAMPTGIPPHRTLSTPRPSPLVQPTSRACLARLLWLAVQMRMGRSSVVWKRIASRTASVHGLPPLGLERRALVAADQGREGGVSSGCACVTDSQQPQQLTSAANVRPAPYTSAGACTAPIMEPGLCSGLAKPSVPCPGSAPSSVFT